MPDSSSVTSKSLAVRVALLALVLLALGFVAGYGFQSRQNAQRGNPVDNQVSNSAEDEPILAPVVKGLRVRPDDRLLAFTGIYNQSQKAGRFVFDMKTRQFDEKESPQGWQDYITEWSEDGNKILFEREKIPRPAAETTAGLYEESIAPAPLASTQDGAATPSLKDSKPRRRDPEPLAEGAAPAGERIISGQWSKDGLIVKTRREPKSLYFLPQAGPAGQEPRLLDQAGVTYYQNRATQENGRLTLYVVRNVAGSRENFALFRVQDGQTRQLSPIFQDIVWAYISEDLRWMVICRYAENGEDWIWSLYSVTPQGAKLVKEAPVPGDAIVVYWSPDSEYILGSSGESLWLVDIPSLQVRQLGERTDWFADDAAWLNHEKAVIVAAGGVLWKVRVPEGTATQLWRFPAAYWK